MYYSLNTPHRQNIQKVYHETLHIPISHILQSFVEVYLILLYSNGVNWRKNAQPKHYWLCFIQGPYWGQYGQGGSLSDSSEELLQWGKGRARIYRHFCWKKEKNHVVKHQRMTACWEKTRHLKLKILVLFYLWEDAKFWAHWNYSLDLHLYF